VTLPFFKKVYQLKNRIARDLPDIPQLVNSEMLVIKKDFYRVITRQLNRKTSQIDTDIRLTMYYNIFALAFGYDTLEIYFEEKGKKKHVKYINLYEKMSTREQAVIDYISGILKYMQELDNLIGNKRTKYRDSAEERLSYTDLFTIDDKMTKFTGLKVQTIPEKFPEIKVVDEIAYMYNNSYFENANKAGLESPPLKVPFTNEFREISQIVNNNTSIDANAFKESCHQLITRGIDPLQVFIKANFIKAAESRTPINDITYEEKLTLANFFNVLGLRPPSLIRNDGTTRSINSDIKLVNGLSNLKKISTVLFFEGFDQETLKSMRISLTKRNVVKKDVIQIIDPSNEFLAQNSICDLERTGDLGSFPVNFSRSKMNPDDESSLIKDIAIERDQKLDEEIGIFTENRIVSRDLHLNGGFACTDLKKSQQLISTVDMAVIGDSLLKRDVIFNYRTGEFLVNSTITPNKILGHYNKSKIEQLVANITLHAATIPRGSGNYRGFPKNVIRIIGKSPELLISRIVCEPFGSGTPFLIPVFDRDMKEFQHIDPIGGVKYKYRIYFAGLDGTLSVNSVDIAHRTYPRALSDIELKLTQKTKDFIRVDVLEDSALNIAKNIEDSLQKIFADSPSAATFYNDFFKEKVNENLQNIGKLFQLYVQVYDKTSSSTSTSIMEPLKDTSGIDYFRIPTSGNERNNIITYHLIITNPLELVSSGFESIEDPATREKFTRRTAAFFNTFTLAQGTIPAEVINKKTGAKFYTSNPRVGPLDPFGKITCIGGMLDSNLEPEPVYHNIWALTSIYNPDDGECTVEWRCIQAANHPSVRNVHIDFFVVTAEINGVEFPVSACPFVGFTFYKIRTDSFLGAAFQVKFRVYSVYNDFHIQANRSVATTSIVDIRKTTQEL
tara:strand:+ start:1950 stop:4643 length:2694 start_codon:yes stop_codon:yes gene_type:complete